MSTIVYTVSVQTEETLLMKCGNIVGNDGVSVKLRMTLLNPDVVPHNFPTINNINHRKGMVLMSAVASQIDTIGLSPHGKKRFNERVNERHHPPTENQSFDHDRDIKAYLKTAIENGIQFPKNGDRFGIVHEQREYIFGYNNNRTAVLLTVLYTE